MRYQLPDEETLGKYMYMLRQVLVQARFRAYSKDPQLADLLDAVENVPDLLLRWPDMKESIVLEDLHRVETAFPEWKGCFTRALEEGAPEDWQLKWKQPK